MEAIPSDLVRLGIDISSRLDSPFNRSLNFSEYCTDEMILNMPVCNEEITFVFTSDGITAFVARIGAQFPPTSCFCLVPGTADIIQT